MTLEIGTMATVESEVRPEDLATIFEKEAQDTFPPVFATAHMIGLMEVAGARVLHPLLQDGELSVGVSVDITHAAPTLEGNVVTATARFAGMEGKLYVFEVIAHDPAGEIGRGIHKRAIVSKERLMTGAQKRNASSH